MTPKVSRKRKRKDDDDDYVDEEDEDQETSSVLDASASNLKVSRTSMSDVSGSPANTPKSRINKAMFIPYSKEEWSPLYMYRPYSDLTAAAIRQSGSEGVGRIEIGGTYGINTSVKGGNRRVSGWIMSALKVFPDYFGQFQKMDGRLRCLKYFWKVDAQPEHFSALFDEWTKVCDIPCPFTIGQVIKFPKANLNTLRISDVTLRRLIDMVRMVKESRIIVTLHRFIKIIISMEQARGYNYQIDKKSVLKCLFALQRSNLVHLFEKIVLEDNVSSKVQLICHASVLSADDPDVDAAIRAAIDEFHENGRVFPHGQLRLGRKKLEEHEKKPPKQMKDFTAEQLEQLSSDNCEEMTIEKRLALTRLQSTKLAQIQSLRSVEQSLNESSEMGQDSDLDEENSDEEESSPRKRTESKNIAKVGVMARDTPTTTRQLNTSYEFRYDPSINYGHQAKMIKCYILHQFTYHVVYGLPEGTKPTLFDRFPPSKPMSSYPDNSSLERCPVYVDDESPLRFAPPLPRYEGRQRGWFMLNDLVDALPLSIVTLIVRLRRRCDAVENLLRDHLQRHVLVLDLPQQLRMHLLKDKRIIRQVEHLLLTMAALGLVQVAPNPDPKRYPMIGTQFFFLMSGGMLRDTSTSDRGYSCVTQPIDQYRMYSYSFDTIQDVRLYWHHFRAIVQSTPLAFRLNVPIESSNPNRMKKYAIGVTDKSVMLKNFEDTQTRVEPLTPHDGCAGFDSALFVHLRRHWDVNPRPSDIVNWFLVQWRRSAEVAKPLVDARVERLQKTWNSYIKSLMPTDGDLWKKNKEDESVVRSCHTTLSIESKKIRTRNVRIERKTPAKPRKNKKRPLDSVDLISEQRRMHMRSRFTPKERDMLIMIRAVGFFLNPVYRFWLDPTVLRDVMHEYVPESRTKTVQSLMAAGVREMVRPNKVAYLQRIVRNLTASKDMRVLRSQLATQPLSDPLAKRQFFIKAFNMAIRLLFMESNSMPSTSVCDEKFEQIVSQEKLKIATENPQVITFPTRSQKPKDLNNIRHCVAFNVVLSMLLCDEDLTDVRLDRLIEQLSACSLSNVLEQLRVDGLIAKQRPGNHEIVTNRTTKNQATLSYYFRHFFNHRFHLELVEQTNEAYERALKGEPITSDDRPGMIVAAMSCFYSDLLLDLTMPDDLLSVFDMGFDQLTNVTKRLRHLESADLRLEKIIVTPVRGTRPDPPLPTLEELLNVIRRVIPRDKILSGTFQDFLLAYPVKQRELMRKVHSAVLSTGVYGASMDDVKASVPNETEETIKWCLKGMEQEAQVVLVGVDVPRYVTGGNASCWVMNGEHHSFFSAPWTTLTGDCHKSTVRWMLEGILFSIANRPGGTMDDLKTRFAFALQPRMLLDLLSVLEKCECVKRCQISVSPLKVKSPFEPEAQCEVLEYILPTVNCMERFSRIFYSVELSEVLTTNRVEYV